MFPVPFLAAPSTDIVDIILGRMVRG
jgi:hypothetical protein